MLSLIKNLNLDVFNLIQDFAGTREYWMRRFSNDVLVEIDQGWRLVGWGGEDMHGTGEKAEPCPNCYSYGTDICSHERWEPVSYREMVERKNHTSLDICPMPWHIFKWVYRGNNSYDNYDIFFNLKKQLKELCDKGDKCESF